MIQEKSNELPALNPLPEITGDFQNPVILLNGTDWVLNHNPSEKFLEEDFSLPIWEQTYVPGQVFTF